MDTNTATIHTGRGIAEEMTMYAITVQRSYYTATFNVDRSERLISDAPVYPSRADALAVISRWESQPAWLGHGEYATPTYRVVRVGTKRHARLLRRNDYRAVAVGPGRVLRP